MAPFDYFEELLPKGPTVHERLESYLKAADEDEVVDKNAKPYVMTLPVELLGLIMDFLPSKIDLAQACKVDSRFFVVATPRLYNELCLKISDTLSPHYVKMFTASNVGMRFIRRVSVTITSPNNTADAVQWLEVFINQFPYGKLVSFTWDPPHAIPSRLIHTLWDRQRKLERLEILPTQVEYDNQGHPAQVDLLTQLNNIDFADVKSLRIVPDTTDAAWLGCAALQHGTVTDLEVDARLWQGPIPNDEDEEESDDDEDQSSDDSLTDCLFDHLDRVEPGLTPAYEQLTALTLKDVDLSECEKTWCTYLNFCRLKNLTLEHCVGADIFLLKIAPGASTPALRTFTLLHTIGFSDVTIHAISELLDFPKHTLETLILCLRNCPELPKSSAIRGHGKSLRKLLLDITSNFPGHSTPASYPTYDHNTLQNLFKHCPLLKEVGIALGSYSLEYKGFTTEHELRGSIDLIVRHLRLSILNILNWPQAYHANQRPGYYAAKAPQFARLAADIFSRHRRYDRPNETFVDFDMHTQLGVIAFGIRDRNGYHPQPTYFLPSEVTVAGKKPFYHAGDVSMQYLRRQRWEGGILDYEKRDFDAGSRSGFQYYDHEVVELENV